MLRSSQWFLIAEAELKMLLVLLTSFFSSPSRAWIYITSNIVVLTLLVVLIGLVQPAGERFRSFDIFRGGEHVVVRDLQ